MSEHLSRRVLQRMQNRWEADLTRLEQHYGSASNVNAIDHGSAAETIRNLATACAEINGVITSRRRGDPKV